ncbi:FimV/HubP family polar landmark protein [Rhodanobacter sp. Col0626]|uniref:FimV/HubP family polar landmark protein n=1 Tax=Rhodanobacter sp. Col0626 TaxID=3415679 RepID=UPI003CECF3B0
MNRSLKLSMLVALALGSSQVLALDLGQIQVKSALGQPLLAEIPLHPGNPAELQNLTVQLASSEEFVRAGIAGGRTTIPLHFSVANAGSGHPVIRITSSTAVDDPYLDLLIEVNGSAGKSVREFAILLDPPNTLAATPSAMASTHPAASRRSAHARTASAQTPAPRPAATSPKAAAAISNGRYGPVEHGQTLSGIARSTAPAGVDVKQMMLALQQANPDAFYRDNINALKSGAVLRVPTSAEAQAMTIAAAVAQVRQQNSDWRAGTPGKPAIVADTATRASASSAPSNTSGAGGDRLALVPAKDGGAAKGSGGNAAGKSGKSAAGIRQDLLRTQESVASLEQQGTELKSRLKDLADINDKNEHLLSLKDSEIAELQAKLAAARKTAGLPAAPATTHVSQAFAANAHSEANLETARASTTGHAEVTPVAGNSAASAAATPAITASASAGAPVGSSSAPVAAVKPAPVKPVAKPVIRPTPAPVVEQPWYMQTWAWAAGAGVIVLLILLAMLDRRRKSGTAVGSKSSSSLADRFGSVPGSNQDLTGDDVDQDELLDQLAEHPDDIGLHLELVTLYYSRRDVEHFEAAAEAMHAHITDPQQDEWQDVLHMGEDLVPGHPLFDHHPELPRHQESEARREFDIDDYADDSHAPAVTSSMPPLPPSAPKRVSEYNFNFDLTRPAGAEPAADHLSATDDDSVMAPAATDVHDAPAHAEPASTWHFDEADDAPLNGDQGHDLGEFNDDPIDTKLDLARAYLDMGDADGARAMLGEVMKEGSQMQQDVAKRLLESLR